MTHSRSSNMETGALLIIDDEPEVLNALQRYFRRHYTVRVVSSAEEGFEIMKSSAIQVVISDQRMPGMKGTEFFRIIREHYPEVVRIILTGYADIDAVIAAINDGNIFRYITKPWNPDELNGIVEQAFEHYTLIEENRHLIQNLQDANIFLEGRVKERTAGLARANRKLQQQLIELRLAEDQVRRERDRAQQYLDVAGVMILVLDRAGNVNLINRRGCEILGYGEDEVKGNNWFDTFLPARAKEHVKGIFTSLLAGQSELWEYAEEVVLARNGDEKTIAWHNTVLRDETGNITGILSSGEDITERRRTENALRESEARFRTVLDSVQAGILLVDAESRTVVDANPEALRMLSRPKSEVVGQVCHRFVCPAEEGRCPILDLGHEVENAERVLLTKSNETIPILKNVASVAMSGRTYLVESFVSIAERKKMEDLMRQLAYHDTLTGLPNRTLFDDRLTIALAQTLRENDVMAVMMMDLDRFKDINDALGHPAGDELLRQVGMRLTSLLRKGDTVARIGGDEFILLLPYIKDSRNSVFIAEKIIASFRTPFILDGVAVTVTASIGIALCPDDGKERIELIKSADKALYRAKESGRNSFIIAGGR